MEPALAGPEWCVLAPADRPAHSPTLSVLCRLDEAAVSKKELVLIEALEFKLLERHPYETLETLLQGARCGLRLCKRLSSHAGTADVSLGHHATRCYAIANDTYRYTDLCMLQPPEARRPTTNMPLLRLTRTLRWPRWLLSRVLCSPPTRHCPRRKPGRSALRQAVRRH